MHHVIARKIREIYTSLYDSRRRVRIFFIVVVILIAIYYFINAFMNYDRVYLLKNLIFLSLQSGACVLVAKIFHEMWGKWMIHEQRRILTEMFVEEKLPRSIKIDGPKGVGKDSSGNAIRKIFAKYMVESIEEEMDLIRMITYIYDFESLEEYLDQHHEIFETNSKGVFYNRFITAMKENQCFIKPRYLKDFTAEEHLEDLSKVYKDPFSDATIDIPYQYDDGVNRKHYLTMLIRYISLFVRSRYMSTYLFANQPMMESKDRGATLFSTAYTEIRTKEAQWVWPLDGHVIILETEVDGLYPNVSKEQSAMTTGTRDFKAFFRHFFDEESVWITIGQNAGRTEKTLRELDFAFVRIIEQTKVFGGQKRIFFIRRRLLWVDFWIRHSLREKSRERQLKRRSKAYQRIRQLMNTGYIYVDVRVARSSDAQILAQEVSVRQLLQVDKPIQVNYMVKLCFTIHDCWWGYNTRYIESIAEMKAKQNPVSLNSLPRWDSDLTLKMSHIGHMRYRVLDKIAGLDRKKYDEAQKEAQNPKVNTKFIVDSVKEELDKKRPSWMKQDTDHIESAMDPESDDYEEDEEIEENEEEDEEIEKNEDDE